MKEKTTLGSKILSLTFAVLSTFWLVPIFLTLINSFKSNNFVNLEAFALHRKGQGQDLAAQSSLFFHYASTSLLRVIFCCASASTATRMKKMTALAWATPWKFLLML